MVSTQRHTFPNRNPEACKHPCHVLPFISASLEYGPIIHPDFIAVFPKPPLVGYDVRLECFAYGRYGIINVLRSVANSFLEGPVLGGSSVYGHNLKLAIKVKLR